MTSLLPLATSLSIHYKVDVEESPLTDSSKTEKTLLDLAERINLKKEPLQDLNLSKQQLFELAPYLEYADCHNLFMGWEETEILNFLQTCSNRVKFLSLNVPNLNHLPPLPNCETLDCSHCRSLLLLPPIPKCTSLNFLGCKILEQSFCGFPADIVLNCLNSPLTRQEIDEIDDIKRLALLLNLKKISFNGLKIEFVDLLSLAPHLTFLDWENAFKDWTEKEVLDFLDLCSSNITLFPPISIFKIPQAHKIKLKSSIPEFITNYLDRTQGMLPQERLSLFQAYLLRHDGNIALTKLSAQIEITLLNLRVDLPNTSLNKLQQDLIFFKTMLSENDKPSILPKIKQLEEKIVGALEAAKMQVEKYFSVLVEGISQNLLPKNILEQLLNATIVYIAYLKKAGLSSSLCNQLNKQVDSLQCSIEKIPLNHYLTASNLKEKSKKIKSSMSRDELDARLLEGEQALRIPDKLHKELFSIQDGYDKLKYKDHEFFAFLQERSDNGAPSSLDQNDIKFVDVQQLKKNFPKTNLDGSLCIAHTLGERLTQEDTHLATTISIAFGKELVDVPVFGIFDGHSGPDGSKFLSEHLERKLKFELRTAFININRENAEEVEAAIFNTLKTIFHKLTIEYLSLTNKEGGSTACVALFLDGKLWVANLGDCRAILSVNGLPIVLSRDGGLDTDEEMETVKKRGGIIKDHGNALYKELRVQGINKPIALNMSRSACEADHPVNTRSKVTCFPLDLLPPGIKTLCIACDGAFDAISSMEAAQKIYENIQNEVGSMNGAARSIINHAYHKGSGDNISTLLLDLSFPLRCKRLINKEEEKEGKEEKEEKI